jgi:uncharacterized membrane protein
LFHQKRFVVINQANPNVVALHLRHNFNHALEMTHTFTSFTLIYRMISTSRISSPIGFLFILLVPQQYYHLLSLSKPIELSDMPHLSPSPRGRLVWACYIAFICFLEVESFGRSIPSKAFPGRESDTTRHHEGANSALNMQSNMQSTKPGKDEIDKSTKKNEIVVSSEIDLPFSAETAFDAFSDMSRQTSWSPWLRSVEYTDETRNTTLWKMKFLGISSSWLAVRTYEDRPHCICWTSIQGLQNQGRVDFIPDNGSGPTRMKMTMTFQMPSLVARMLTSNGKISRVVEKNMVQPSLENFCQDVLQNDLAKGASTATK